MPRSRALTRLALPGIIVATAVALLAWASWRAWAPLTTVEVEPVIARTAALGSAAKAGAVRSSGPAIQAPGWIEPSPFAIRVAALVPSVVREVLVLEGDRVKSGDVVARLVDDEEKIALRRADAEVGLRQSELNSMRDERDRKTKLLSSGSVSQAEVTRLGFRVDGAAAALAQAEAARDEAALALARTEVRAPSDGVVMARLATPGSLVGLDAEDSTILQMFDPASLQVRVDVPLSDAGRLAAGQTASVLVDALPGTTIAGKVIRLVQQADIAKNTVQAKVLLIDPPAGLVPDMLARVRIDTGAARAETVSGTTGRTEIVALERAFAGLAASANGGRTGEVPVVVDVREGVGSVERRMVEVASTPGADGWVVVVSGLRPGDLVVTSNGAALNSGQSVRIGRAPSNEKGEHDGHR